MKKKILIGALALMATSSGAASALAEDIKISGRVFFDYSTKDKNGVQSTGGDITRTYITAAKKMDDRWSAKITIDSALNTKATGRSNQVFLKNAQLTGKFSDALNVKLGLIGTPWIGYADGLNGHRYIAKSYSDTHGLDSSADAGLGVFGKLMNGDLAYDVVLVNGGGYGNTKATDATDINARVGIEFIKGLTVDVGFRNGYKGSKGAATESKSTLIQALVSYGNTMDTLTYRAGINLINSKTSPTAGGSSTDTGQEIWLTARQGDWGGYVRVENTSFDAAGSTSEVRTVVSADYHASQDIVFSLVNDTTSDVGGINGVKNTITGLYSQFKF